MKTDAKPIEKHTTAIKQRTKNTISLVEIPGQPGAGMHWSTLDEFNLAFALKT